MFGEKNITKFLGKHKDLFGFSVELEWCKLRRVNRHILRANPGVRLVPSSTADNLYHNILAFVKDCQKTNFFKRLEFIGVFQDAEDDSETHHLQEYWVLRLIKDTGNRFIFQADGNIYIKI